MNVSHSPGFIHRDLQPGNILLDGLGEALIADFGRTRRDERDYTRTPEIDSIHYAAPEQYQHEIECATTVDVFAFGLIVSVGPWNLQSVPHSRIS
jgi:serine/threonine protein kinase